ncbi:hypothetical protein Vadar_015240 [Vaccinium darrowii]|uniref:Uncharacterized protein n=1 Tax=Vaccinium darrowii TaxID=229202 RepID=A0ACB7YXT6_9ERIC|nr:hypothetical protein Vadar_015240 [Vaccinium darrowii]
MPSSSSASSTFQIEYSICHCGKPSPMRKSKTKENPGRRFLGCGNYEKGKKNCEYFYWIDPDFKDKEKEDKIEVLQSEKRALHLKCQEMENFVQELLKENKKLKKKLVRSSGRLQMEVFFSCMCMFDVVVNKEDCNCTSWQLLAMKSM